MLAFSAREILLLCFFFFPFESLAKATTGNVFRSWLIPQRQRKTRSNLD